MQSITFEKKKEVFVNLLFLFLGLLLFLTFFEITLRVLEPAEDIKKYYRASADPFIIYEHVQNVTGTKAGTISIIINEDGFRDKKTLSSLQNTSIIGVFGDSVTFGWSTNEYISEILQHKANAEGIYFYNFAVGGYNIKQEVAVKKKHTVSKSLFLLVLNDPEQVLPPEFEKKKHGGCLIYSWNVTIPCFIKDSLKKSRVLAFFNEKINYFRYEKKTSYTDFLWEDAALVEENVFAPLRSLDNQSVVFIVPQLFWKKDLVASYPWVGVHQKILSFCAAEHILCVDLLPELLAYDAQEFILSENDILHYNEKGLIVLAERILFHLNKTIILNMTKK